MGDRLTEKESDGPQSFGDIFDALCPQYMAIGMTPEQYWDGESGLKKLYREAYRIRMETEQRVADRNNWYMGQYLISALQAVPLLVAGLNVKSSTRLPKYPDKPFLEQFEEEKKEKARKQKQEDQTMLAMAMFQAGIEKFNRNFMNRQEPAAGVDTGQ